MYAFKEREIVENEWSEAFYNLHRHVFSLRQHGLVVLHADCIWLQNVKFAVQPSGLEKVRESGVKNVHAFVRGNYIDHDLDLGNDPHAYLRRVGYRQAYYNPHKVDTFVDLDTMEPIYEANHVILIDKRIYYR